MWVTMQTRLLSLVGSDAIAPTSLRVRGMQPDAVDSRVPQAVAGPGPMHAGIDRLENSGGCTVVMPASVDEVWVGLGRGRVGKRARFALTVLVIKKIRRSCMWMVGGCVQYVCSGNRRISNGIDWGQSQEYRFRLRSKELR